MCTVLLPPGDNPIAVNKYIKELYMFRTDQLSIIRSLNTVYKSIGICHASYVDCLLADNQQS